MEATRLFGALALLALVAAVGLALGGPPGFGLMAGLAGAWFACAALTVLDPRRGATATALFAAADSAYLLQHKWAASGPSICNVDAVINCDAVNASEASLAFGVPITLFGLAFYLGLALAAQLAGPLPNGASNAKSARFDQVNVLFGVFNVAYSAYLAWQSTQIGAVCVVCVSMYAANALLLWGGWSALRRQGVGLLEEVEGLPTSTPLVSVTVIFLLLTSVGASAWHARRPVSILTPAPAPTAGAAPAPPPPPEAIAAVYHLPAGPVTPPSDEPILGAAEPKVVVLEYADYACPHCAHASKEIPDLVRRFPDIQVRFRAFPLTAACNPALERDNGPERCFAALAAHCAGVQGKFWEMNHLLFINQPNFTPPDLTLLANQVGLDATAWQTCMNAPESIRSIQEDAVSGAQAGLQGTPTFFVWGLFPDQWIQIEGGVEVLSDLLTAHRSGQPLPPPPPAPPPAAQ